MKKHVSLVLLATLCLSIVFTAGAFAEEINIDDLDLEELNALEARIAKRISELEGASSNVIDEDGLVPKEIGSLLYDENGLTIYFDGWEYSEGLSDNDPYIVMYYKFINESDEDYALLWTFGTSYVNDWDVNVFSGGNVAAHKKCIDGICLQNLSKIGVIKESDITSVECNFTVMSDSHRESVHFVFDDIHAYPKGNHK